MITRSAIQTPARVRAKGFFKASSFVGPVALLAAMNFPATRALVQRVGTAGAGRPPVPTTKDNATDSHHSPQYGTTWQPAMKHLHRRITT